MIACGGNVQRIHVQVECAVTGFEFGGEMLRWRTIFMRIRLSAPQKKTCRPCVLDPRALFGRRRRNMHGCKFAEGEKKRGAYFRLRRERKGVCKIAQVTDQLQALGLK